jgi:putative membrane protein
MFGWNHDCSGFLPVVVCIALALLICFLVSRFLCGGFHCGTHGESRESAADILKARYARGEISREEFERIKEEIK